MTELAARGRQRATGRSDHRRLRSEVVVRSTRSCTSVPTGLPGTARPDSGSGSSGTRSASNADGTFSGVHTGSLTTPGDILILGTFTQGGATSNIRVFKWVGTGGNATSNGTVQGPTGAFGDCVGGPPQRCWLRHRQRRTHSRLPWPYTPSRGRSGTASRSGGFVEGGINLSDPSLQSRGLLPQLHGGDSLGSAAPVGGRDG